MEKMKHYNPEFIVELMKKHFDGQLSIDEISREYEIEPEQIIKWKNDLFAGAVMIFSNELSSNRIPDKEKTIKSLKNDLKTKEKMISELEKDNIELKKILCNINEELD